MPPFLFSTAIEINPLQPTSSCYQSTQDLSLQREVCCAHQLTKLEQSNAEFPLTGEGAWTRGWPGPWRLHKPAPEDDFSAPGTPAAVVPLEKHQTANKM